MSIFEWFEKVMGRPARKPERARQARLGLESLETRLTPYSVSGNAWVHPEMVTIGFVPDGTVVGSNAQGPIVSNLQSTFNTKFGSAATWQNQILKAAQQWAAQTNINFVVVTDNGAEIGTGLYQQGDPNQADIRIGGYNFGTTTLAQAYMPAPINNTSFAGDIQFNTSQTWNIGSTYDLSTVATHEFGHALGLYHSTVISSVEYGNYNGVKSVLNADDIAGIRAITGYNAGDYSSPGYQGARLSDSYDVTASNSTSATASDITSTINAVSKTALVQNLEILTSDVDYYKFTVPTGMEGTLTVKAQSSGLSLLAPTLTLYSSTQTQLATQTAGTSDFDGSTLSVGYSVVAGQTYYVKVAGVNATAIGTGKYALSLGFASVAAPTASSPNTQTLNGTTPSGGGGQAIKLNPEFLVNNTTAGIQQTTPNSGRGVAMDAFGNYVVVWASQGQDNGGTWGVYGQRFAFDGTRLGSEFRVNTTTASDQNEPAVAMDGFGNFVVTWSSVNQDSDKTGIYAQRYNSVGQAQGGEFRVNTYTKGDQKDANVAMNTFGNFVVTWSSNVQDGSNYGVYAQRYNSVGQAQGGEFRVNTTTANHQIGSRLAMDGAGNFVIIWTSTGQDGDKTGVYGQRYNAAGSAVGGEFRINTTTAAEQTAGDVAMDGTGDFVVVWQSNGQDGDKYGIYAQRYNSSGVKQGGEFRVNKTTSGEQQHPTVAMDGFGNFVVTWSSNGQDSSGWGVYGQQYDESGNALGLEFQVNTTTAGDQTYSSMAMNVTGSMVAVWSGSGTGDTAGVYGQRFLLTGGSGLSPMEAGEPHGYGPDGCGDEHDHDRSEEGHEYALAGDDHGHAGAAARSEDDCRADAPQRTALTRTERVARIELPAPAMSQRRSETPADVSAFFRHLAESSIQVGIPRVPEGQRGTGTFTITTSAISGWEVDRLASVAQSLRTANRASASAVGQDLFDTFLSEPLDGDAGDAFARSYLRGK